MHFPENTIWNQVRIAFNRDGMLDRLCNLVNCLGYASNRLYAPTGDARDGYAFPNPGHFRNRAIEGYSPEWVLLGALRDGFRLTPDPDTPSIPVAAVVAPGNLAIGDHHWYRLDSDGFWSHKRGNLPVSRVDASDNIIFNPLEADHLYLTRQRGEIDYTEVVCFFWVPLEIEESQEGRTSFIQPPPPQCH